MYRPLQVLCVVLVVGASAQAQPPNPPLPTEEERLDRVLDRLELSPAAVAFEIDYEGSPHTGCYQTMQAYLGGLFVNLQKQKEAMAAPRANPSFGGVRRTLAVSFDHRRVLPRFGRQLGVEKGKTLGDA